MVQCQTYIKKSTLFVQTSRHEEYGLSLIEACILIVPVITTEFDTVYCQMIQGKNGLLLPRDPLAIVDSIERLFTDRDQYQSIVEYPKNEKKVKNE